MKLNFIIYNIPSSAHCICLTNDDFANAREREPMFLPQLLKCTGHVSHMTCSAQMMALKDSVIPHSLNWVCKISGVIKYTVLCSAWRTLDFYFDGSYVWRPYWKTLCCSFFHNAVRHLWSVSIVWRSRGIEMMLSSLVVVYVMFMCFHFSLGDNYVLDDKSGLGRTFDGIGGLSGGGVRFWMNASVWVGSDDWS